MSFFMRSRLSLKELLLLFLLRKTSTPGTQRNRSVCSPVRLPVCLWVCISSNLLLCASFHLSHCVSQSNTATPVCLSKLLSFSFFPPNVSRLLQDYSDILKHHFPFWHTCISLVISHTRRLSRAPSLPPSVITHLSLSRLLFTLLSFSRSVNPAPTPDTSTNTHLHSHLHFSRFAHVFSCLYLDLSIFHTCNFLDLFFLTPTPVFFFFKICPFSLVFCASHLSCSRFRFLSTFSRRLQQSFSSLVYFFIFFGSPPVFSRSIFFFVAHLSFSRSVSFFFFFFWSQPVFI